MRFAFTALSIILTIGSAAAQVSGPTEGIVFDAPTKSLRAVIGFLGSASLGPAIVSRLDFAAVAPQKSYAIAFHDGKCLVVSGLDAEHVSATTLTGEFPVPEGAAWSSDGSVVLVYSRTGNWIRSISNLATSPAAADLVDLSSQGTFSTALADAHGERLIVGLTGDNPGVFQIGSNQSLALLSSASNPVSLALSGDGLKLYILDGISLQVTELSLADQTSTSWPVADLADPIAVQVGRDAEQRQVIYVAGRKDQVLLVYDSSTHDLASRVSLPFQPSTIDVLGKNSYLLRLRVNADDPLWSFRNSVQPGIYFVPATPLSAGEDSSQ